MEHVNGCCFCGIYKGGLWEDHLHVSALKRVSPDLGFCGCKVEHYLDDLRPVLNFTATNYQEPGRHII